MVASKKKKKPTANSTRGFATTSTPSKPKDQVPVDVQESVDSAGSSNDVNLHVNRALETISANSTDKAADELSPEQLEKELEDSDLLLLVEKYGESTKKNVSHNVQKLQTERRLLRAQAVSLNTRPRLPPDSLQLILDRLATLENGVPGSAGESIAIQRPLELHTDGFLVDVWTLYQILPQLGFSDLQREHVLRDLLQKAHARTLPHANGGKDHAWGLPYCLEWFARSADSEKASTYDGYDSAQNQKSRDEVTRRYGSVPDTAPEESTATGPSNEQNPDSRAVLPALVDDNSFPQTLDDSESDVASDLEPDEMINKYLALRTQLFQVSPETDEQIDKKGRKHKPQSISVAHGSTKAARLDSKMAKLKSDILFDKDEAERQWYAMKLDLVRDHADRKRLGVRDLFDDEIPSEVPHSNNSSSAMDEVADEASMLGELFSSLPDTDLDGGLSLKGTGPTGALIKVRDFGKWNGMSPRRVFEEACRARYATCRKYDTGDYSQLQQRFFIQSLLQVLVRNKFLQKTSSPRTMVTSTECGFSYCYRWDFL